MPLPCLFWEEDALRFRRWPFLIGARFETKYEIIAVLIHQLELCDCCRPKTLLQPEDPDAISREDQGGAVKPHGPEEFCPGAQVGSRWRSRACGV